MRKVIILILWVRRRWRDAFEAQPRVKGDQINQIVAILRRDFNIAEQNEIVLEVIQELTELREKDIVKMDAEFNTLKEQTTLLKNKMLC